MMKLFLFCAFLAVAYVNAASEDAYCFGTDTERPQTRHFSTKTAYQIIKGTKIETLITVPQCKATKAWIFHRHGTRLPGKKTIMNGPRLEELRELIVQNAQVKKSAPDLCTEDLFALKLWKWNTSITADMADYLTAQGYEDLKGTAKLYQRILPEVFPREFNDTYYMFRHTDSQRTSASFKAFAEALFGSSSAVAPQPLPEKDLLLRPYQYCSTWDEHNFLEEGSQSYMFRKSSLWNETLKEISTRLGFDYILAEEDVMLMFDMCRYEQAWQVDRVSPWCAAFLEKHVLVFEYNEDLKHYYKSGYGYEDNSRLQCRAVQDMIHHLQEPSYPGVIANFGHSDGLQTLIAALGLSKDMNMLNATNFASMKNRKWQTSLIDPFASNFVAIKYDCPNDFADKSKVMFFLNQYAVDLNWCKVGLCNWSDVVKRYDTIIKANCDDYYCQSSASFLSMSFMLNILLAAIVYLIN